MEEFTNGTDNNFIGARFFSQYGYSFTGKSKFFTWVEYLPDFENAENFNVNAETALVSTLNGFLSLKSSYAIKFDNEPAPGATETDTILSVILVINSV